MKKAFSLLEIIFVIVIIGIIAGVGIPKLLNTKKGATASVIMQDVSTMVNSIQSYCIINDSISKISDAVNLNSSNWSITDKKVIFKDGSNDCISVEIKSSTTGDTLEVAIDENAGNTCKKIVDSGFTAQLYNLN